MAALLISEHTPLFGFMEHGYRLEIVISLAAEAVVIVSLGVFLACAHGQARLLRETPVAHDVPDGAIRGAGGGTATEP